MHQTGLCRLWMLLTDTGKALSTDDMSDRRQAVSGMSPLGPADVQSLANCASECVIGKKEGCGTDLGRGGGK